VALPTSGTSGVPRAVVRTTESWVSSFGTVGELTGLTSAARVWVPGPLTATMNLFAAVHARHVGAGRVGSPAAATHAYVTPSALAALLDEPDSASLLSGTDVVVAGERLTPALHDRAVEAGARVHHYYGAAELSFVAWGRHADDLRPFPGVEVDVRDGLIRVRSPYVCLGYAGAPGALRRDDDGFVTVGDRGRRVDGRLEVLGRDDAVTVGAATVRFADVEPALQDAARGTVVVVGVPHPTLGAVLAAVLTSADDLERCREAARRELQGAHRPRLWFRVERLPSTAHGKVDRERLVSLVSGAEGRDRRLV
jgi:long-chain acyl-CoA synthetase